MINKICPICSGINPLYKKEHTPEIYYYRKKTKCKKIKILECKSCGYAQELHKNSFDKNYKKEFINLRNEVTKEMVRNIVNSYISENGKYSEIERLLYLEPNYFSDILNDKRKIQPEDAALIAIIYNFPFIIKCASYNFDAIKSIEYIKYFISNREKAMERNAKEITEKLTGGEDLYQLVKKNKNK